MAQMYKINNEAGDISFPLTLISEIISDCVQKMKGDVFLSTSRAKLIKYGTSSESNSIITDFSDGNISVKVYVVIRFGAGIAKTTKKLMRDIETSLETFLGKKPKKVLVHVSGVISKRIAKRNIEVSSTCETEI